MGSLASFRNRANLRTPLVQSIYVEVKTRYWSAIQGATAFKFGIYFGRVKSDSQEKYQFTVFAAVKGVTELVREGAQNKHDFAVIDGNPLSSMFKAKILSLYFPGRFLAVCNPDHLDLLARGLDDLSRSENSEPPWMLNCLDWVLVNALDTTATSPADQFIKNAELTSSVYVAKCTARTLESSGQPKASAVQL